MQQIMAYGCIVGENVFQLFYSALLVWGKHMIW